jgi:hypothetical protein
MSINPENKYIYSKFALDLYNFVEQYEIELSNFLKNIKDSKSWRIKLFFPQTWLLKTVTTNFKIYIENNPKKFSKGTFNSFSNERKALLAKYIKKSKKELQELEKLK